MGAVLKSKSLKDLLVNERRAAFRMFNDSRKNHWPPVKRSQMRANCLILHGYWGPSFAYYDLARWLRSIGIWGWAADFGWLNRPSLKRQVKVLFREVKGFRERFGQIDYVIGHSLGGIEAVGILPYFPGEIKKVISIAAPFNNGKPWGIVELGARIFIAPEAMQKEALSEICSRAKPYAERIVTIATRHDRLVPPAQAAFRGAKNIVISDKKVVAASSNGGREKEKIYMTHIGLPNSQYVREEILRKELLEPLAT